MEKELNINILLKPFKSGAYLTYTSNIKSYIEKISLFDYFKDYNADFISDIVDPCESVIFIDSVFVLPEHQGNGFSNLVFNRIYSECVKLNVSKIFLIADLSIPQSNDGKCLIEFYKKKNFSVVNNITDKHVLMYLKK